VRTDLDAVSRRPLFIGSYAVGDSWTNLRDPFLFSDANQVTIAEDLARLSAVMSGVQLVARSQERRMMRMTELIFNLNEGQVAWHPLPWPDTTDSESP